MVAQMVLAEAHTESLDEVHATIARFWSAVEQAAAAPPASRWRFELATAVWEIAANVVYHAYPSDAAARPMQLRLRLYPDRAEALFTDRGGLHPFGRNPCVRPRPGATGARHGPADRPRRRRSHVLPPPAGRAERVEVDQEARLDFRH
jgi:anti-sigma regulatory factor (Ser/Thr protein kinase)